MNPSDIFEDELQRPSVFKDEQKLSIRYVPNELHYRTPELKFLARHFKGLVDDGDDGMNLIIHGPIGCGKTSITKKFGIWASQRKSSRKIEYVHINCRVNRSTYTIFLALARELNEHIPSRGYASHELLEMVVDILESQKASLIFVLDEVDFVPQEEISDLIYSLSRTADNRHVANHHISLILIARTLNFMQNLDESTVSTLGPTKLELDKYNQEQLSNIFENRIAEVFKPGTVSDESLELTASIAGKTGDARKGLELLWYAGKYADQHEHSIIYPDFIRIAKSNIQSDGFRQVILSLESQKLLVCFAIARGLQTNRTAFITMGELKEFYALACEEFEMQARQHTQLWEYVKELDKLGIINTQLSTKGHRGTTTLITIEEPSAKNLEEVVTELLLE